MTSPASMGRGRPAGILFGLSLVSDSQDTTRDLRLRPALHFLARCFASLALVNVHWHQQRILSLMHIQPMLHGCCQFSQPSSAVLRTS